MRLDSKDNVYDWFVYMAEEYARLRGSDEPIVLIEESTPFNKNTIVSVFVDLAEANEAMQSIAAALVGRRICFEASLGGRNITVYNHRFDQETQRRVRFVRARLGITELSKIKVNEYLLYEEDVRDFIRRRIG